MCGFSFCADSLLALTLSTRFPLSWLSHRQLNATLQPLQCFDANMLKMLPTELIAFGKLLPASAVTGTGFPGSPGGAAVASRQMQRPPQGSGLGGAVDMANDKEVLHISVNGLHRWTPQFENHIWKHLGKLTLYACFLLLPQFSQWLLFLLL